MDSIKCYIANSTGKLTALIPKIEAAFEESQKLIVDELGANQIDVIFIYAPLATIPEMGVGGNSPDPHNIYVSFDPEFKGIKQSDIVLSVLHEAHHCMRWRDPGYGKTLGEAMISEGLASLFEEEYSGEAPIYTRIKIKPSEIKAADMLLSTKAYDHAEWFFGSKDIQRWFGYTYGYQLCKAYSKKVGKNAAELVRTDSRLFLNSALTK